MGSTAHGLPWPDPTAPVRNGSADIRALAEAIDPRIPNKTYHTYGGYSTNVTGDVAIPTPGITTNVGMIGTIESTGSYFMTKMAGPGNGVIVLRVFNSVTGAVLANGFIIMSVYTWGT